MDGKFQVLTVLCIVCLYAISPEPESGLFIPAYGQTEEIFESDIKNFVKWIQDSFREFIPEEVEENPFNTTSDEIEDTFDSGVQITDGIVDASLGGHALAVNIIEIFTEDEVDGTFVSWILYGMVLVFGIGLIIAIVGHMLKLVIILGILMVAFLLIGISPSLSN